MRDLDVAIPIGVVGELVLGLVALAGLALIIYVIVRDRG